MSLSTANSATPTDTSTSTAASASAARCSAFPCPYGWPGSAGRPATPTAKNVSSAATRSVPECTASETRPEAAAREASRQLEPDERAGGAHGDERRPALRSHGESLKTVTTPYPPAVRTCPSCGHENETGARFCSQCATPLEPEVPAREERKVVTCLFCDLVGFTARAEQLDPEDVRAVLQPYHARVRAELERFGGTVEKFIGDAVMAVFGAPVAHEDDPERAVRAALAIRDTLGEEQLDVRIGITTGEALITLGARPEAGEGMAAGDVVNTAARLQSAAPTNAILVDETTFRATERAIEYGRQSPSRRRARPSRCRSGRRVPRRARVGVERVGGAAARRS